MSSAIARHAAEEIAIVADQRRDREPRRRVHHREHAHARVGGQRRERLGERRVRPEPQPAPAHVVDIALRDHPRARVVAQARAHERLEGLELDLAVHRRELRARERDEPVRGTLADRTQRGRREQRLARDRVENLRQRQRAARREPGRELDRGAAHERIVVAARDLEHARTLAVAGEHDAHRAPHAGVGLELELADHRAHADLLREAPHRLRALVGPVVHRA